jgi:hypothetical protein
MKKALSLLCLVCALHFSSAQILTGISQNIINEVDTDFDGQVSVEEAAAITFLTINPYQVGWNGTEFIDDYVFSYAGIDQFPNLTLLTLANWPDLEVGEERTYTLPNCPSITELRVSNNQLSGLNTVGLPNLVTLYGDNNLFNNNSDFSLNEGIENIHFENNEFYQLDFSLYPELKFLFLNNNNLTQLDVSTNQELTTLYTTGNSSLPTVCVYNYHLAPDNIVVDAGTIITDCSGTVTGQDGFSVVETHPYPNPTNGIVNLIVDGKYEVISIRGERIDSFFGDCYDMSGLTDGVYVFRSRERIFRVLKD